VDYVTTKAHILNVDLTENNAKMKIIMERMGSPGGLCMEISSACCLSMLFGIFVFLL